MDIERSLRSLRWRGSAESLERRVLAAARHARVEQTLWRWMWRGLAASVLVATVLNASIGPRPSPPVAPMLESVSNPSFPPPGTGELRERARLALSPPITLRKFPEVLP